MKNFSLKSKRTRIRVFMLALFLAFTFYPVTSYSISGSSTDSRGPFFWEIEKDGKQSYVLGTLREDVNFDELQCYKKIEGYLNQSDVLFREPIEGSAIPYIQEEIDELAENRVVESQKTMMNNQSSSLPMSDYSYYKLQGVLQDYGLDFLNDMLNIEPMEERSIKRCYALTSQDDSVNLDDQIVGYFIKEKPDSRFNIETERGLISIITNLIGLIRKYTLPFDDSEGVLHWNYLKRSLTTQEDLKEWVDNYERRCSEEVMHKVAQHQEELANSLREQFLSGELNLENYEREKWDRGIGYLDTEIKQDAIVQTKYFLDYRHERWLPRIVSAHGAYNSVFFTAGLAHFIAQDRNPHNRPELEGYTEAMKDIPPNVLGMLKEEGFVVRRMESDCSFH